MFLTIFIVLKDFRANQKIMLKKISMMKKYGEIKENINNLTDYNIFIKNLKQFLNKIIKFHKSKKNNGVMKPL